MVSPKGWPAAIRLSHKGGWLMGWQGNVNDDILLCTWGLSETPQFHRAHAGNHPASTAGTKRLAGLSFPRFTSVQAVAVAAMKENDAIAVIIIVLFVVLALVAFGIYRLVSIARANMRGTVTGSSESSSSEDIVDD
ncbi:hypothetical protein P8C59_008883 [Phyllachora maydis]|uniref:Uncharacterized protein n=1 Tax=Phyllachora maydis TaxID=1825666 RepID=A0AAD9IC18_9PEZI|nr:hypothetical protein P8C59_008883 [Phyllachora maydis]